MTTAAPDRDGREIETFAAAVVHELRTPLCALSGEVEIALRRDRPAAAYKEALVRIGARIGELIELTGDLALLGSREDTRQSDASAFPLEPVLDALRARFRAMNVTVTAPDTRSAVNGSGELAARGLTLLVEHAVRHRAAEAAVHVHVDGGTAPEIRLVLDADAPGFLPGTWAYFLAGAGTLSGVPSAGLLRLHAAHRYVTAAGGSVEVTGGDAVIVRLRRG